MRFWSVAVLGLVLDLWSKQWAFETLGQGGRRVLLPYVLEFQTMMNDGALFGIGGGRTTLFLIASALALVLVFWMFAQSTARNWAFQIALGGILAGALGNMYDRAFVQLVMWPSPSGAARCWSPQPAPGGGVILQEYPPGRDGRVLHLPESAARDLPAPVGYVRDFIKIPTRVFGRRELWPWVFNVADMLLVGGVGILAVRLWREREPRRREARPAVDVAADKV